MPAKPSNPNAATAERPSARLAGRDTTYLREALRLLNAFTGGTCNVEHLRGPDYAPCRAQVLTALNGKAVPQTKSGVNALRTLLAIALYAPELTEAGTTSYVAAQAKAMLANPAMQPWEKPPTP